MKKGLVLEGGAMRGLFTAGVLDVLMENKIEFDSCIGVSAGAAFGCNFKSGQIGRAIRYNTRFCKDKRYCSVRSLIKTGDIFGAEFCYHTIPEKLDKFDIEAYDNSDIEFYVVCTDVYTGKPVYHLCDKVDNDAYEWFRASASMPMVSKPVKVGGMTLLDGGMSDSIPLEFMVNKGLDKNLVILTQPRDYTKEKASAMGLMKLSLRKYPNMIKCIANRHEMYNKQREYVFEKEKSGEAFIICPEEKLPIGRIEHDEAVLRKVYEIGKKTAEKNLDRLIAYLK
ncbi:MAG: patatin family protein [Ruminococcus sp.]|nr:patatin family protein [Ruminococcus sp.]